MSAPPPSAVPPSVTATPVTPLWRRALPWVVALAILGFLAWSVPFAELAAKMARAPFGPLAGLIAGYVLALLAADSLGTQIALRRALPDHPLPYGRVFVLRGASYLFATLHYGAGQGAFAVLLRRHAGLPLGEVAGAVLLGMGANLLTVSAAAALGVAIGGAPAGAALKLVLLGLAVGLPVYLSIIAARPAVLTRRAVLAPLFRAGVPGHLAVAVSRLPHITCLVLFHFAALRLFGVDVPVGEAFVRLPLIFVIGVLPIAPSGIGTSQAAAVGLLAPFAPGATPGERDAAVLAYSLSMQFGAMLLQAGLGAGFLAMLGRGGGRGR